MRFGAQGTNYSIYGFQIVSTSLDFVRGNKLKSRHTQGSPIQLPSDNNSQTEFALNVSQASHSKYGFYYLAVRTAMT